MLNTNGKQCQVSININKNAYLERQSAWSWCEVEFSAMWKMWLCWVIHISSLVSLYFPEILQIQRLVG